MNYVVLSGAMFILSEISAYFWHNLGAHHNIVPPVLGVQKTHDVHHNDDNDLADGDFFYILIFLILYLSVLIYLAYNEKISYLLAISLYFPVFIVAIWNWYIHAAYHISNHWLNEYEWFRRDKRIHFQHHLDSSTNYGIATHFSDIILDTYDSGLLKEI